MGGIPKLVVHLLHVRNQLKLFHWQTSAYGAHVALGAAVDALDPQIDELLEVASPLDEDAVADMARHDTHRLRDWQSRAATRSFVLRVVEKLSAARDAAQEDATLRAIAPLLDTIVAGLLRLAYLLKFENPAREPVRMQKQK